MKAINTKFNDPQSCSGNAFKSQLAPIDNTRRKTKAFLSMERVWCIFFWIVVAFFGKIFISVQDFHDKLSEHEISHSKFSDLKLTVVAAFVYFVVKTTWEYYTLELFVPYVDCKNKEGERMKTARKVCTWTFDALYYACFTVFAFIHFRPIIPSVLMGEGSCSAIFSQYPKLLPFDWAKEYYLVQMGSHFYKVIDQVIRKRNDVKFWEYFLHHYLAFCLMLNSYLANHLAIGLVILVTHDITDIFLSSLRAQEALKKKIPVFFPFYFVLTVLVWTYCRGIVFPACEVYSTFSHLSSHGFRYSENWLVDKTFGVKLVFLTIMNFYWIAALVTILVNNARGIKMSHLMKGRAYINNYEPKSAASINSATINSGLVKSSKIPNDILDTDTANTSATSSPSDIQNREGSTLKQ